MRDVTPLSRKQDGFEKELKDSSLLDDNQLVLLKVFNASFLPQEKAKEYSLILKKHGFTHAKSLKLLQGKDEWFYQNLLGTQKLADAMIVKECVEKVILT